MASEEFSLNKLIMSKMSIYKKYHSVSPSSQLSLEQDKCVVPPSYAAYCSDSAKSTHNPYQVTGRKWNSLLSIHTYLEWKHIHYSVFLYTGVYKDSNLIRRARVWAEGLRVAIAFLQRMGMKYCNKEVTCQEKLQQLKVLILVRTRILFPATCHATDNHSHPSSMSKGVILSSDLHRQSYSNAHTYMQTYTQKHNLKYF